MRWGLMKKKSPTQELIINNIDDVDIDIDIEDKPSSSTFSFSNLLPLSSWLSKLKQNPKPKHPPKPAPTPAPTPKPLLSPPPAAPRRLSLDGDVASRVPRHRHLSLGSELEFRPETRRRRPRRQKPKNLKPIKTNSNPDPDPIRPGRKSFQRIRPRVRVYSPRLNPNPNPKALESFAVVKKSSDPVKDFRESMVEMILERRIGRPEELEGLLACYLELNSDEHHDVIVKVFRQVWFELNRVLDPVPFRRG